MKQIRLVRVVAAMILGLFGATALACQSGSGPSSAGASPSPTSSAASSSAVAVKAVIQKANQEQQQGTDPTRSRMAGLSPQSRRTAAIRETVAG